MDAPTTLEAALQRAVQDPASRPEFLRMMLEAEVFVCGMPAQTDSEQDQAVSLRVWRDEQGGTRLPFFTRLELLHKSLQDQNDAVSLKTRALFEMTRGASLILNPGEDFGKEFSPEEIAVLLDHGADALGSPVELAPHSQILIGQPTQQPERMLEALRDFLPRHRKVKAAYLALVHHPDTQEQPGLVVGLQVDGDFRTVLSEAGAVIADNAPSGITVDMMPVVAGEGSIGDYMQENIKPFYKRSWGHALRNLLSPT